MTIPEREVLFNDEKGIVEMPSLTYAIDLENYNGDDKLNMTGGLCDGQTAMKQAIYKILRTQRDRFIIYKGYGTQHFSLFGKPRMYALPELERMLCEALLYDSRIKAVDNFTFDIESGDKSSIGVTFVVHTVFGDITTDISI